ncbi:50S ribosomal protein L11 methyltransferase [Terribacillus saccharophilus]|uniref:Ribosomal protein L11 methyltransferase n=1 Tax=Terribacillus saccharophilus TaxID=361277 RepID=A0A268ACK7_9BACI|nr:50S ribosomal protein L11 methyltransferase [Terribacillus saccharophilus]PAD21857.1 50S ribosomal protein L11 methyltransferase [Terribacillus saccharophilus]PAF21892.1 50S ribosomal protein L11 methyltransferase [Terribacillus saccharophilus]PAF38890.1 50S ribosomal protein L11 methyltransferase [Terribacillus saccharophilus]PAF40951.1 50S ribosomal protein L11 methyltransferase [Terribacillus saccharophilus]
MKWAELCIHTTNEAIEPISNILHEAGASGVVIQDPEDLVKDHKTTFGEIYALDPNDYPAEGIFVKAYLPLNSFLNESVNEIKAAITNLKEYQIDIGANEVSVSEVDEEDWSTAWKKYYKPVKISEKFTIIPTWEDYTPVASDEVIMELDPGMAFGTGTHPTTVLSVQAIERYINKGDIVIDVGSGSGVLSIAAVLLGAEHVHAFDLDDVAVNSTKINAELNQAADRITASANNLLEGVEVEADVIVSNILAEIILKFTDDAYKLIKPGGLFITSGIISQKKGDVKDALIASGFDIVEVNEMEDWVAIIAKKN